jgi:hypothetical protein
MQFQNKEFIIMLVIFIIIATVIILLSRRKKDDDNKELQKNINYENYENYNNKELQKNINYENYENYNNNNTVQTNFCTCRNVDAKNCLPVADRLNNYKNGLTELSKLPKDDGWQSIMPYDIFEKMPEKDKHRINKLPSFV